MLSETFENSCLSLSTSSLSVSIFSLTRPLSFMAFSLLLFKYGTRAYGCQGIFNERWGAEPAAHNVCSYTTLLYLFCLNQQRSQSRSYFDGLSTNGFLDDLSFRENASKRAFGRPFLSAIK